MIRGVLFLVLTAAAYAGPLGELTQPDGSKAPVGVTAEVWGLTYTFAPDSIPERSWLILPGGAVSEASVVTADRREVLSLPTVHAPDVRAAIEVPAGVLSLSLRGTFRDNALSRSASRPQGSGTWITRTGDETRVELPAWTNPGAVGALVIRRSAGTAWKATVSNGTSGGRAFSFQSSVSEWNYYPDAWGLAPRQVTVTAPDSGQFDLTVRAYPPQADLPVDPPTLLAWPKEAWRSPQREWFAWTGTSVLVLVTGDYAVQDEYLKRLAFFVEKTGYRGRLVTDAEVARLHGWNAHDYAAPDLARFFTLAVQQKFPLNAAEVELRDRLAGAGIIVPSANGWEPGTGALVGISADSAPALRAVLFVHEAFHGLYYTSPAFRAGVKTAWDGMGEETRAAFRSFLSLSRYDPQDEALMVNEFQAYILQRRAVDWTSFFRDRVLDSTPAPARLTEFLNAARGIDSLVFGLYGLHSGDVSLVKTAILP